MKKRSVTPFVVRRVAPGSVFRFSILLYFCFYVVFVVAAIVLWTVSSATGLRANVESLIGDLFYAGDFRLKGGQLFRAWALGGALVVGLGAGANLLMAVLYNLISEVVGGVRVELEEAPADATAPPTGAGLRPRTKAKTAGPSARRHEAPVLLARRRESRGP